MSLQYDRIVRLKPIITQSDGLMRNMRHCFDNRYNGADINPEFGISLVSSTGSRHVYTGIGKMTDPLTREEFFLALKLGKNTGQTDYSLLDSKNGSPYGLLVSSEIGVLEDYSPDSPALLGAVVSTSHNAAGLLVEDLTKGGKVSVTPEGELGDFLKADDRQRSVLSDGKRFKPKPSIGKKYFSEDARIDL